MGIIGQNRKGDKPTLRRSYQWRCGGWNTPIHTSSPALIGIILTPAARHLRPGQAIQGTRGVKQAQRAQNMTLWYVMGYIGWENNCLVDVTRGRDDNKNRMFSYESTRPWYANCDVEKKSVSVTFTRWRDKNSLIVVVKSLRGLGMRTAMWRVKRKVLLWSYKMMKGENQPQSVRWEYVLP